MIQIQSAKQFGRAIERAKKGRLFVQPTTSRSYRVTNRENGAQYQVEFFQQGRKRLAHCTCMAGHRGMTCKHVAGALGLHIGLQAIRRKAAN